MQYMCTTCCSTAHELHLPPGLWPLQEAPFGSPESSHAILIGVAVFLGWNLHWAFDWLVRFCAYAHSGCSVTRNRLGTSRGWDTHLHLPLWPELCPVLFCTVLTQLTLFADPDTHSIWCSPDHGGYA